MKSKMQSFWPLKPLTFFGQHRISKKSTFLSLAAAVTLISSIGCQKTCAVCWNINTISGNTIDQSDACHADEFQAIEDAMNGLPNRGVNHVVQCDTDN